MLTKNFLFFLSTLSIVEKYKPPQPAEALFSYSVVGVPTIFSSPVVAIIRRAPVFHRLKVQVTLLCRNAITHFVHWRLPLFLFLNEVPHGRDINHCRLPPYLVLQADLSSVCLRVRWSISFPFGFTFRSHTNHIFVPPFFHSPKFLLRCYYSIYLVFDRLLKFRQILSAILPWSTFLLSIRLVERPPKVRQPFLDLARGFQLTAYLFGYLGVYLVASLWEGIITFRTLLSFFLAPRPCGHLPSS